MVDDLGPELQRLTLPRAVEFAVVSPIVLATRVARASCGAARTGLRRFVDEVAAQVADGRGADGRPGPTAHEPRPAPAASSTATGPDVEAAVDAGSLALADYDHLPASQIVAMLADLDDDERAAIEQYERANRHRRTVLGKLDQLRTG